MNAAAESVIVDRLAGNPLAIYDATWQLLHWNPLFAATFGDPTVRGAGDRNVLIRQFLGELPRVRQTAAELTTRFSPRSAITHRYDVERLSQPVPP
ncbi:MmyB family transcriptional regulator [Streptomyces rhizosphaericus]|uniref:MmyB-like transcription regulator ligand binding domain-containing protein n=1 Tax=Streptomyces rhizosphaericus TaxID=114699 RepID=A0ABN1P955_9ACTN|nr:hypothetical protein [Streptomyces cangkringensis]